MINRFIDKNDKWIFPLPAVIFILVLMVFPLGFTVWNSFTGWSLTDRCFTRFSGISKLCKIIYNRRKIYKIDRTYVLFYCCRNVF